MHTERTWQDFATAIGMKRVLLRLVESRFGPVPPQVRQKLDKIVSVKRLEKLADKILVANSPQEMGLG